MIPFIDLKSQYEALKTEIDGNIARVLDHGAFIMGPEVPEMEQALASHGAIRAGSLLRADGGFVGHSAGPFCGSAGIVPPDV